MSVFKVYDNRSLDVCRIRLDYDLFELSQPNTGNAATDGQCTTDSLKVV